MQWYSLRLSALLKQYNNIGHWLVSRLKNLKKDIVHGLHFLANPGSGFPKESLSLLGVCKSHYREYIQMMSITAVRNAQKIGRQDIRK